MKTVFRITGLDCAEEVMLLKKALLPIDGIEELKFNVLQARLTIIHAPSLTKRELLHAIATTGMHAKEWSEERRSPIGRYARLILTCLSALFLVSSFFSGIRWFDLAAILCGIVLVIPKGWFSLRHLSFDMNLLMLVAIGGALAIDQWGEGATVAFLFSLALLLEAWSIKRANRAITSLMTLAPRVATVVDRGEVSVEDIEVGTSILIRPGEQIPLDGEVVSGRSSVDESAITGESAPLFKSTGDKLYACTLNHDGALICRVTEKADHTVLAQIQTLVEEAREERSGSEQWVEGFAKVYTPLMFLLALLVMLLPPLLLGASWLSWIYRGLVILVIACPCALVIATPVAIVSGMTAAARKGVLIKRGLILEEMGRIKALAVDKTGTLTNGKPIVQQIVPLNGHTEEELLERAVALEEGSEHPLARAIITYAKSGSKEKASNFQSVKGKGAQAIYQGRLYWIGSHRFMHEVGQETPHIHQLALDLEDAGHSVIAIGNDDHVCGLISVADPPREGIRETIESIKQAGIAQIKMLTGDNEATAKALATELGIDYAFELLPEDKLTEIGKLKQEWGKVAMVGDGVNDAPAMAAATIGIAMGAKGSDVAIETSDLALMSDDLSRLPWLIRYSRRVMAVIKQNIWFALGVKLIFVMLALSRVATLWMAVAADTGATLLVIFNALRLLRV